MRKAIIFLSNGQKRRAHVETVVINAFLRRADLS